MTKPDWWAEAEGELDQAIEGFTDELAQRLIAMSQKPMDLLSRKNPFLFRTRNVNDVTAFSYALLTAYLSSSEETKFGDVFERCVDIVCGCGPRKGYKSAAPGIDLEYHEGRAKRVIVQVKSGKNWGNSSQKKKMREYFEQASLILKQGGEVSDVRCIEGICYGKSEVVIGGAHDRMVGRAFWHEVSGWEGTYFALFEIVGRHAGNGMTSVMDTAAVGVSQFLIDNDLSSDGRINWPKLLEFLS